MNPIYTLYTLMITVALMAGLSPIQAAGSDKEAMPKASSAKKGETTAKASPVIAPPKVTLTPTQEDKLLSLLNKGSKEELDAINGIAATRAKAIIDARPFNQVHEIILVPGVGNATFERIIEHGKSLSLAGAKSGKS